MSIREPHYQKDMLRLDEHAKSGLLTNLVVDDNGMIGSDSGFAVYYRDGSRDIKGKLLTNELWYRGVRYISLDRPVYFKRIIADFDARPFTEPLADFLYFEAEKIKDSPPEGIAKSPHEWVRQNYLDCWSRIAQELDVRTFL